MNVTELSIPGLWHLESPVWSDERGFFREWFKQSDLEERGVSFDARQANFSMSRRNVVRGLHYSLAPEGQAKVVTCVLGEIDDVIVDVRVGSPTFGRFEVVRLSAESSSSVLIPAGAAHGFCVLSETAGLSYLLSSPFNAPFELEIDPFDAQIGVAWNFSGEAVLSAKDRTAPSLAARLASDELPRFL